MVKWTILQGIATLMNEMFKRKGINVNVNKTKVMVFERHEDKLCSGVL